MALLDVEAESAALKARSSQLAVLLDASVPAVDLARVREARAEGARLNRAAAAARARAADRVERGQDPGCPVGRQPAIRRVRSSGRNPDVDSVLRGRAVLSAELFAFWRHQVDVVAPAIEGAYRSALQEHPHQEALVFAVTEQLARLAQRGSFQAEGGAQLLRSLGQYQAAYYAMRDGLDTAQDVASSAAARIDNLEREAAAVRLGLTDDTVIEGLIASAVATAAPDITLVGVDGSTVGVPISGK